MNFYLFIFFLVGINILVLFVVNNVTFDFAEKPIKPSKPKQKPTSTMKPGGSGVAKPKPGGSGVARKSAGAQKPSGSGVARKSAGAQKPSGSGVARKSAGTQKPDGRRWVAAGTASNDLLVQFTKGSPVAGKNSPVQFTKGIPAAAQRNPNAVYTKPDKTGVSVGMTVSTQKIKLKGVSVPSITVGGQTAIVVNGKPVYGTNKNGTFKMLQNIFQMLIL